MPGQRQAPSSALFNKLSTFVAQRGGPSAHRELATGRMAYAGGSSALLVAQSDLCIECIDQLVDRTDHRLDRRPVRLVVPLRLDLFIRLPLLLHPRVVLQVV